MSRKIKPVSFNKVSEYDSKLLAYAESKERGNFSQYVKRLIDADMNKTPMYVPAAVVPEPTDEDAEAMSGFL
ncbi:hypothetical protein [Sporosarcina sp. A2]|uniref:hypothetical protein n=1 Tax=Sporosarcina sp. A2 TaxID=3393449 RepID=UPI003D7B8DE9